MKKFLCVGVASIAAFAFVAVAQAPVPDVGFENIFDGNVSIDLKVNGQDGPVEVASGSRIVVSWLSEGAARCKGNWSKNDIKTSGTVSGRISRSVVIKAACIDKENNRDDDAVVVNVSGKPAVTTPVPVSNTGTATAEPYISITNSASIVAQNARIGALNQVLGGFDIKVTGKPATINSLEFDIEPNKVISRITNVYIYDERGSVVAGPFDASEVSGRYPLRFTNPFSVPVGKYAYVLKGKIGGNNLTDENELDNLRITLRLTGVTSSLGHGNATSFPVVLNTITAKADSAPTTSAQPSITSVEPSSMVAGSDARIVVYGSGFRNDENQSNAPVVQVTLVKNDSGVSASYQPVAVSLDGTNLAFIVQEQSKSKSLTPGTYRLDIQQQWAPYKRSNAVNFTITAPAPTASTISVDLKVTEIVAGIPGTATDGPLTVSAGRTLRLSYTTTGKVSECKGDVSGYSAGSAEVVVNAAKTYTVSCTQDGGTGTASDSVRVEVAQPTATETPAAAPVLSASAPTISGTRTAAGDKLYPGSMSITATISNSGGPMTSSVSARFEYSTNNANWYPFQEVGPITTTPKNVSHTWDGGSGNFCFRVVIDNNSDTAGPSTCIEIVPQAGAFIGVSRELAAAAVPDTDVWNFLKAFFGR